MQKPDNTQSRIPRLILLCNNGSREEVEPDIVKRSLIAPFYICCKSLILPQRGPGFESSEMRLLFPCTLSSFALLELILPSRPPVLSTPRTSTLMYLFLSFYSFHVHRAPYPLDSGAAKFRKYNPWPPGQLTLYRQSWASWPVGSVPLYSEKYSPLPLDSSFPEIEESAWGRARGYMSIRLSLPFSHLFAH